MDLITRPLTKKEVSSMVENDEIPFTVLINKNLIPISYDGCDTDDSLIEKISELVLGDNSGEVTCWKVMREINPELVKVQGRINVANFLFGEFSARDLIEYWEEECAAHLGYSNDKKDMYEGKW
ncbi:MAG TPA: hypothetical protein DCW90_22880 [Lachnospiraceae bacterium]|nr:hypothetical protein [Lachnospiraceae bacterium]